MNNDEYFALTGKLPLGIVSFEELRSNSLIYVDKTAQIYTLACFKRKVFLSRPRRFGKSLLVSTFESLFRHGLRDFQGLDIEKLWNDQKTYEVVRLDFSRVKRFSSLDEFKAALNGYLKEALFLAENPFPQDGEKISENFAQWMSHFSTRELVLLIDEYDAPLTACLTDPVLFSAVRSELSDFYSVVKEKDQALRFLFITGITKFNQTGIFSELNHLDDITLWPQYSTLLGYTREEIAHDFSEFVSAVAQMKGLSQEALLDGVQENYDGYCFDGLDGELRTPVRVHTPWSVLKFFNNPSLGFKNYWISSGGHIQLLEQYFKSKAIKNPQEYAQEKEVDYDILDGSSDLDSIDDVALLTQAGYLTIKRRKGNTLYVSYPNREVAVSMARLYAEKILSNKSVESVSPNLIDALEAGNLQESVNEINRAFLAMNSVSYPVRSEAVCQGCLQLLLCGAGFYVATESQNALGRSDLEFDAGDLHWVLELKFLSERAPAGSEEKLLSQAVEQIRNRRYGEQSRKELRRAALVFSERQRCFVRWCNA